MNKDQLIAKQQLEIEDLKEKLTNAINNAKLISQQMYNVWWPLNDNRLQFNLEQRNFLRNIAFLADDTIPDVENP